MQSRSLKLSLAPPLWKVLANSWRVTSLASGFSHNGPLIFACLHRDILPALCYVKPAHPCLLISNSSDGDILVATLGPRDYGFVRGSTGKGGPRALVGLRRCLEDGRSVGLAVDGPRGPFGVVQSGVLHLARITGVPILPLRASASPALNLRTWDRTLVPLPGGKVCIVTGSAESCPHDASDDDLQAIKYRLEQFFAVEQRGGTWK